MDDTTASGVYDPERPWVRSAEEDPKRANWLMHYFNPTGRTPKMIFNRGQAMLWIIRLVIFVVAFMEGGQSKAAGAAILFIGFGVCALMSLCLHVRRLDDSGKHLAIALIAILPFALGSLAGVGAAAGMAAQAAKARAERSAPPPAPVIETAESGETESADGSGEASEAAEGEGVQQTQNERRRGNGPQGRGGPEGRGGGGSPPLPPFVFAGLNIWMLLGLPVAIFSFVWVARQPSRDPD